MNNKQWHIFNHLIVTVSSIGIYTKGWHVASIIYFNLYVVTQILRIREEFLLKQKTKKMLDAIARIEASSPEVFEAIEVAVSQGMTVSQVSIALNRLSSVNVLSPSKQCQSCRFWHGKNNVVCAVHPSGYEGDFCTDFEEKP